MENDVVDASADPFAYVPAIDPLYVPFGFFNDMKDIIAKEIFYTVYVTGLSGNGKTKMIEQACAQSRREYIRANITKETDEFDLIGSYNLVDGNTVWRDGPVLVAMKRGAILLLDETDLGSERLLCLQPILEGTGYFNKKKGEFVVPATGFNVLATANTKGKGSDDGRFIGANVLNEAFLERFAITVEQDYPSEKTERLILTKLFDSLETTKEMDTPAFTANLTKWAELLRTSYKQGATDEVITTRRLCHIAKAYCIFKNKKKALELCLNRFDDEIKTSFLDFYSKIDASMVTKNAPAAAPEPEVDDPTQRLVNQRKAAQKAAAAAAQAIPTGQPAQGTGSVGTFGPAGTGSSSNMISPPPPGTRSNANLGAMGTNKVTFGDARNISSVSVKYRNAFKCDPADNKGNRTITVNGLKKTLTKAEIEVANNNGTDLLDLTVKALLDKSKGISNTTTDDDDD